MKFEHCFFCRLVVGGLILLFALTAAAANVRGQLVYASDNSLRLMLPFALIQPAGEPRSTLILELTEGISLRMCPQAITNLRSGGGRESS
jgi:hypothetical protein